MLNWIALQAWLNVGSLMIAHVLLNLLTISQLIEKRKNVKLAKFIDTGA